MRRKYFLLLTSEKLSIKKLNFLVFLRNLAQKIKIFVQKNARMDIFFRNFLNFETLFANYFETLFANCGMNVFVRCEHCRENSHYHGRQKFRWQEKF